MIKFLIFGLIQVFLSESNTPSRFSTSSRTSPPMSPHSGGGETINTAGRRSIMSQLYRLSNENVSSVYDDRLDKIDPEGTLVPGQRR